MQVDLEELARVKQYLRHINNTPLDQIEWIFNGKKLDIDSEFLAEWRFVGLNNTHFIESCINDDAVISLFKT